MPRSGGPHRAAAAEPSAPRRAVGLALDRVARREPTTCTSTHQKGCTEWTVICMSPDNALDLLGIKGLSDSVKVATQGFMGGAAAFLSRVCLPAAEEFGLALRDRVSAWRARNATRMLSKANTVYLANDPTPEDRLSPRLAHVAIEEASWIDDEQVQDMWSGLLASSTSSEGRSDDNLIFMNLLKQLSSLQVKVLRFAVEQAPKHASPHGLIITQTVTVSIDRLPTLFDTRDLQRLDRELDHLRELGLLGSAFGGGINVANEQVDLTPSPLATHLYVRAQGSRRSPVAYWNLTLPPRES